MNERTRNLLAIASYTLSVVNDGAQGPQGPTGPQGPKGDTGETVRVGTSYNTAQQVKLFFKVVP